MSLAIRGNDFNFFFSTNKAKIELVDRKWTQKSTLLGWLGGWVGVFTFLKICWENLRDFFFFFLNVFSYQGERI